MKKATAVFCLIAVLFSGCFGATVQAAEIYCLEEPLYYFKDTPRLSCEECISQLINTPQVEEMYYPQAEGCKPFRLTIEKSGSYVYDYLCTIPSMPWLTLISVGFANRNVEDVHIAPYVVMQKMFGAEDPFDTDKKFAQACYAVSQTLNLEITPSRFSYTWGGYTLAVITPDGIKTRVPQMNFRIEPQGLTNMLYNVSVPVSDTVTMVVTMTRSEGVPDFKEYMKKTTSVYQTDTWIG